MNDRPPSKRAMEAYARLARPSDAETGTLHKQVEVGDRLTIGDDLDIKFMGIYGTEVLTTVVREQKAWKLFFPLNRQVDLGQGVTIKITWLGAVMIKTTINAPRSMKIEHLRRGKSA